MPPSSSSARDWVTIEEAQDVQDDVALAPTRVTGVVRRGGTAAPRYTVRVSEVLPGQPASALSGFLASAASDDEGKYELTLWKPGSYLFVLCSPEGVSVPGHKDLATDGDDEKKLDFDVSSAAISGMVTDEGGMPVAAAWVAVMWQGGIRTMTDDQGRFQVDVQGNGSAGVLAGKAGFRRADTQTVQVAGDQPIPPVTLVLKRQTTAAGTLFSATGAPVAGALVASIATTADGPTVFATSRSQENGSFEVGVPPGPRRVFVSGPDCPLSSYLLPDASADGSEGAGADDDGDAPVPLVCPDAPASFQLILQDEQGKAVPYASLILRQDGIVVPQQVLAGHLQMLGLPPSTDGSGHLVVPFLAAGDCDLYLSNQVSAGMVAAGSRQGFLSQVALAPMASPELTVTLPQKP